jgi:hypothetical protein
MSSVFTAQPRILFADGRRQTPTNAENIYLKNIRVRRRVSAAVGELLFAVAIKRVFSARLLNRIAAAKIHA